MALVRWNPGRELASMEVDRLNRMFSDFYGEAFGQASGQAWLPPVDIYEDDTHDVVIKAELPEMKREDIGITFENSVLTIKGERQAEDVSRRDTFQRMERHYGSFSRSFTVPATVDANRISAAYKDGVLTVRLPQREDARPKQIPVGE